MTSILIITAPADEREAINQELTERGYGPCLGIPLSGDHITPHDEEGNPTEEISHYTCHWPVADHEDSIEVIESLRDSLLANCTVGIKGKAQEETALPVIPGDIADARGTFDKMLGFNVVMRGDTLEFEGKTWESLIDYNVWDPPIGWREIVEDGYPAWVQPTGAHDAYPVDFIVTHNGQNWINVTPSNVWEPGVFGWEVV